MMLAALLLTTATPLGVLDRQELPAKGCAAYLWSTGAGHPLIAMVRAEPAALRVVMDGKTVDLALTARRDAAPLGFARSADYIVATTTITLDMTVQIQLTLKDGGRVPEASLTIVQPGKDIAIVPVAGLIGCAPA